MTEESGLKLIVQGFLARLDEVVERGTAAIWEAVPSYARPGEPYMNEVREAVRSNVGILADVLSERREIAEDELESIERVGAQRAEAGIPLQDVLHAYRTVSRAAWGVLSEECRGKSEVLIPHYR